MERIASVFFSLGFRRLFSVDYRREPRFHCTHTHYYEEISIDALYQSASVAHKPSLCDQQSPQKTGLWSSWQAGAADRCFQNLGLLNRFWFVSAIAFVLLRSEEGLDELWNEHFTLDVMELTLHAQGSSRELRTCSSLYYTVYSNWNCTLKTKTRFVVNVQWKQSRFCFNCCRVSMGDSNTTAVVWTPFVQRYTANILAADSEDD